MRKDKQIKIEELYRILGVRQNAGINDITKAYHERLERLSSADYADEPGYAAKKRAEVTNAYEVLTKSTAHAPKPQVLTRQNHKNQDGRRPMVRTATSTTQRSTGGRTVPTLTSARTDQQSQKPTGRKQTKPSTAPAIIVALSIIAGLFGTLLSNLDLDFDSWELPEVIYQEQEDQEYVSIDMDDGGTLLMYKEEYNVVSYLNSAPASVFGFKKHISSPEKKEDKKSFEYKISSWDEDMIDDFVEDTCFALGIYDVGTAINAITKDIDFCENSNPSDRAAILASLLKAPGPEDLNGKISEFTGDEMSDYVSYYEYIRDVVEMEAPNILN